MIWHYDNIQTYEMIINVDQTSISKSQSHNEETN